MKRMPLVLHETDTNIGHIGFHCGVEGVESAQALHLERVVYATVQPLGSQTIVEVLDDAVRPLQDLLTVCTGQPIEITRLKLRPVEVNPFGSTLVQAVIPLTQPEFQLRISGGRGAAEPLSLHDFSSPTLHLGTGTDPDVECLLRNWMLAWDTIQPITALLLGHLYAPFMYTQQRYSLIFQAVEAFHSLHFDSKEMLLEEHKQRVAGIVEAARQAGREDADVDWAERVLTARNDKPLRARVEEVIHSTGGLGEELLRHFPQFARDAARLRGGVSHPGRDRSALITAKQYWSGDILSWVARVVLLQRCGVAPATTGAAAKHSFREAIRLLQEVEDQLR